MRLALVQTRPILGDREANLAAMARALEGEQADLFAFPELATTGYAIGERERFVELAEDTAGGSVGLAALQVLAESKDAGILAGFPLMEEGRLFNTCGLFRPGLPPFFYRKLHLFSREKQVFDPGDRPPPVTEFRGCRVGMMICFDWIVPEVARILALAGADLILHPSNLVTPYCQRSMFARSVENSVYIATINRVGDESYEDGLSLAFTGASQLMGPRGEMLLGLGAGEEEMGAVDFDPAAARDKWLTPANHVLDDRRREHFGALLAERDELD